VLDYTAIANLSIKLVHIRQETMESKQTVYSTNIRKITLN